MANKSLWTWRNAGGQLLDAFIPGNAYNPYSGKFNPTTTKVGVAGAVAGQLIPGGEKLVTGMANRGMLGQGIASGLQNERASDAASKGMFAQNNSLSDMFRQQTRNAQFQWAPQTQPAMTGGGTLAAMVGGGGNRTLSPNLTPNNWQQSVWDQNLQQMQNTMANRTQAMNDAFAGRIGAAPTGAGFGGGGVKSGFGFAGYQSPEHRAASIAATQDAMRAQAAASPNNRQSNNYLA